MILQCISCMYKIYKKEIKTSLNCLFMLKKGGGHTFQNRKLVLLHVALCGEILKKSCEDTSVRVQNKILL